MSLQWIYLMCFVELNPHGGGATTRGSIGILDVGKSIIMYFTVHKFAVRRMF